MSGIKMTNHKKFSNLTYFTTSYNGYNRLAVTIEFLRATGFDGHFIIVDATLKNQSSKFVDYKFVTYKHQPECSAVEGVAIAASLVATPYAAFIGDDDLPILSGVEKVLSFLERNQDFDAASGRAGFVDFDKLCILDRLNHSQRLGFAVKTFLSGRYDKATNLEDPNPSNRINEMKKQYIVSQFFITRTKHLHRIYNDCFFKMSDVHASEYSFCFAHSALCRSKKLSHTYLLRGTGSHRPNANPLASRHRVKNPRTLKLEIEKFFRRLDLPSACLKEVMVATKETRLQAEKLRMNTINSRVINLSYLFYQIRRLHFALTGQTRERLMLALGGQLLKRINN